MTRRILVAAALVLLGLPACLLIAGLVAVNTDWGRARLVGMVQSATADGPVRVEIGALTGPLPGRIGLDRVRLSDATGVFAELDRVDLVWSPWALLTGTVAVDSITAGSGRFIRAPVLPSSPTDPAEPPGTLSLAFPVPPVAVRLGRLRVSEVRIDAAVIGREAVLSADLAGSLTGSAAIAKGWLQADSVEGATRLDLDLAVVPEDGTLRADLRAHEAAGGVAAGLLGVPGDPPLDLTLTGTGNLTDWKGRLVGGLGTGAAVDLALGVADGPEGTRITVDGTAGLDRLVPDAARALLGPSVALGVTARMIPGGGTALERVSLRADAGTLDGTARLSSDGLPVAADATVRLPRLEAFADLAGTALSGDLGLDLRLLDDGRRVELSVSGSPVAESTALDGLTLRATGAADRPLATLPDSVTWTLDGSVATPDRPDFDLLTALGPRLALQAAGTAGADGRSARIDRLTLTTDAGQLQARAHLTDARRIDVEGTLALTDLSRLSDLAGRPLTGSATLGVDGTVLLDPFDVSALIDLAARELRLADPALDRLVGDAPLLSAGVTLDAGNRLSVHGLTLRTAAAEATGDAELALPDGALDGRIDITAGDLATIGQAVAVDLSGRGTVAVALGGTVAAPSASASWRLAPFAFQGTRLAELTGSATALGLPDQPSGRVDARASGGGQTVTLGADYALAGDRLRIDGLALDGAGLKGRGALSVNLAAPSVDGKVTLTAPDLGRVGALAGQPVSAGSLDATVALSAANGQTATLSGKISGLVADGAATVSSIQMSGEGKGLLTRPSGTFRAEVGEVRQGDRAVVGRTVLRAESDGKTAKVSLTMEGKAPGQGRAVMPYRVSTTASADLTSRPPRLSVDTLNAKIADAVIALEQPTRITLGAKPRVDDVALRIDGGRLTGGGRVDPRDLDLQFALRDLPTALVRLADPDLRLKGTVDADLTVRGPLGDPVARLTVSAPSVRSADPALADLPALSARAEVGIANRRLTASADASVGESTRATLSATASLASGAAGSVPSLDVSAPQDIKLDAEAALDALSAFLPLNGGRVAGQAAVHVTVTGTPANPLVNGSATLRDGAIDQPSIGLYLVDLQLDARGQNDRLVVETLTAKAVSGGTLAGSGSLSFDVDAGMPADLTLTARQLDAVDTDEANVVLNADLTLAGKQPEYRLAGAVTVLPSEVRIPDQLPPSVVELEVTEVRDGVVIRSPEKKPTDGEAPAIGPTVVLDITIDIPGQVFVRGRGLDSEWGGGLTVAGRLADPDVRGDLQVRRGRFDGLGRTFNFDRGRIVFDGSPPSDPTLDMVLVTEVADIKAKVLVTGRAQSPGIELTSEPALPREEVLSRILFGSPRAQLSPLQALKLAQSAAVLSGRLGSGTGITNTIRETLGADTLDVDAGDGSEGSRGASLSVGKYVAPGVFLKLQQALGGTGSKAVVEVEITDSISVETDVGADSQSRVGVNWKVDY